jgi:hypothetical protein
MDVLWIDDARIGHGGRYRPGGFFDLCAAAEFLGQKIPRVCHPNAQTFPGNAVGLPINDGVAREDGEMRTEHTFRATGHHERDPLFDAMRRQIDIGGERGAERGNGIFAREIVDATIALGLAQYREDRFRVDFAGFDQVQQASDVAWAPGRDANDVDRCCAHGRPLS